MTEEKKTTISGKAKDQSKTQINVKVDKEGSAIKGNIKDALKKEQ